MARRVKVQSATSAQIVGKLLLKLKSTLCYRRQVREEDVRLVLQSHTEGSSLRSISRRISSLAYDTVVSTIQAVFS